MAYINPDINQESVIPRKKDTFTASLQVYATNYVRGELLLPPAKLLQTLVQFCLMLPNHYAKHSFDNEAVGAYFASNCWVDAEERWSVVLRALGSDRVLSEYRAWSQYQPNPINWRVIWPRQRRVPMPVEDLVLQVHAGLDDFEGLGDH
ncbi:hypothetical protein H257_07746 [Aphanomyces astaci]|uniref:Uncharacterized protein n=1 Tax=Aphanomyces astaci TaxID=112090 RepID=W4GGZ2_APHAT|nr:hypothetical protein H257_07746 [Aphanomyces astaci]ETV78960.1 hypothetical protein H257_07746 [Aphanomyces astaci]|eukprot:XP_009831679.1 hypothetical protein H257_07746 [Aphanomyces astaci]